MQKVSQMCRPYLVSYSFIICKTEVVWGLTQFSSSRHTDSQVGFCALYSCSFCYIYRLPVTYLRLPYYLIREIKYVLYVIDHFLFCQYQIHASHFMPQTQLLKMVLVTAVCLFFFFSFSPYIDKISKLDHKSTEKLLLLYLYLI